MAGRLDPLGAGRDRRRAAPSRRSTRRAIACSAARATMRRPCSAAIAARRSPRQPVVAAAPARGARRRRAAESRRADARGARRSAGSHDRLHDRRRCATTAGAVAGAVLQFRDLTPYERSAEQERLRERLAALGEMAAGLAHEIRNPLAGMEILDRAAAAAPAAAARGSRAGERAHRGDPPRRADRDRQPRVRAPDGAAPRSASIRSSCSRSRSRARARACRSTSTCSATTPRRCSPLRADGERLESVLTNLIVNAFEAMHGAGSTPARVSLGVRVDAPEAVEATSEPGPPSWSSPSPTRVPAFPTSCASASSTRSSRPSSAARASGSRRRRRSSSATAAASNSRASPGRGSTFRVRLPLSRRPRERDASSERRPPAARASWSSRTTTRCGAASRARSPTASARPTRKPRGDDRGRAAARSRRSRSYDVIVTDLRLPGAGGLEVLEAARASATRAAR